MVHLEGIPAGEQAGHFQHDQVQETDVGTRQKYVTRTDIISVCILANFFWLQLPHTHPTTVIKKWPGRSFHSLEGQKSLRTTFPNYTIRRSGGYSTSVNCTHKEMTD